MRDEGCTLGLGRGSGPGHVGSEISICMNGEDGLACSADRRGTMEGQRVSEASPRRGLGCGSEDGCGGNFGRGGV